MNYTTNEWHGVIIHTATAPNGLKVEIGDYGADGYGYGERFCISWETDFAADEVYASTLAAAKARALLPHPSHVPTPRTARLSLSVDCGVNPADTGIGM